MTVKDAEDRILARTLVQIYLNNSYTIERVSDLLNLSIYTVELISEGSTQVHINDCRKVLRTLKIPPK